MFGIIRLRGINMGISQLADIQALAQKPLTEHHLPSSTYAALAKSDC